MAAAVAGGSVGGSHVQNATLLNLTIEHGCDLAKEKKTVADVSDFEFMELFFPSKDVSESQCQSSGLPADSPSLIITASEQL